jgi:hypothetical protein
MLQSYFESIILNFGCVLLFVSDLKIIGRDLHQIVVLKITSAMFRKYFVTKQDHVSVVMAVEEVFRSMHGHQVFMGMHAKPRG